MLIGGKGYGKDSQPGKIHNIHTMNISGNGQSLIQIEEAIANCSITQGVYWGVGDQIIQYEKIDSSQTANVLSNSLVRI